MPEIFFLVIAVVCWWFVVDKRMRERHSEPARLFYRLPKHQQQMLEACSLAAAIVGGVFSTVFLLFFLVKRIVG